MKYDSHILESFSIYRDLAHNNLSGEIPSHLYSNQALQYL